VGDKTNDVLRVDAEDVAAQVVGEGANLGVTQKGRIAFARKGGRINSDAIDNSAGVDTSDHEVNIKILLAEAIRTDALKAAKRDKLLESMTDEVGALVLTNNYDQTLALTLTEERALRDLDSHERFIQRLEAAGKLARRVEGLPTTAEFATLRAARQGLTRPEQSKLIAYAKIDLFDALVASRAPDDPAFEEALKEYFPKDLWKFEPQMRAHRLRREIIATQLANDMINRCGPTFVDRVREVSRAEPVAIASSFEVARKVFDLDDLVDRINALDNKAPAAAQSAMHQHLAWCIRRLTTYLARNGGFEDEPAPTILEVIARYRPAVAEQRAHLSEEISEVEAARASARTAQFMELGAPEALAREVAELRPLTNGLDVADLARRSNWPVHPAALLHCVIGAEFGIDALREAAGTLHLEQHWDRLVVRRASEDFAEIQVRLCEVAAAAIGAPKKNAQNAEVTAAAREWIAGLGQPAHRARGAFAELNAQGQWTFAKLMLIQAELNAFVAAVR
jgi:glutamate dehydrogenase